MSEYIPDLTERYPEGFGMPEEQDVESTAWDEMAREIELERKALIDAGIDPEAFDHNPKYLWDGHKTIPNPNYDPDLYKRGVEALRRVRYTR